VIGFGSAVNGAALARVRRGDAPHIVQVGQPRGATAAGHGGEWYVCPSWPRHLVILAMWWLVGFTLAPLRRWWRRRARDERSLIRCPPPAFTDRAMVTALSLLLARLAVAFDAQRAFVAVPRTNCAPFPRRCGCSWACCATRPMVRPRCRAGSAARRVDRTAPGGPVAPLARSEAGHAAAGRCGAGAVARRAQARRRWPLNDRLHSGGAPRRARCAACAGTAQPRAQPDDNAIVHSGDVPRVVGVAAQRRA
jgi:hypothetical protein